MDQELLPKSVQTLISRSHQAELRTSIAALILGVRPRGKSSPQGQWVEVGWGGCRRAFGPGSDEPISTQRRTGWLHSRRSGETQVLKPESNLTWPCSRLC